MDLIPAKLALFAADFYLWRFTEKNAHLNNGFQKCRPNMAKYDAYRV